MNDILNISPIGINKNNNNKNKQETKKDRHHGIHFTVRISHEEARYYNTVMNILYNLRVNGRPLLDNKSKGLPSLCKMALNFFCNNYRDNVLAKDGVIDKIDFDDTETLEMLLHFRQKYLNYPFDQQIADLKKKGVLA